MKSEKLLKDRESVLKAIEGEFNAELFPAVLTEEGGAKVLSIIMKDLAQDGEDARGEFFFMPGSDDDEMQFFVNLVTISSDLVAENLAELMGAVSIINTFIIAGCFAIDPAGGSLIYRHPTEMTLDVDKDAMKERIDLSMGTAIQVVSQYAYVLLEVNEGKRKAETIPSLFLQE